MWDSCSGVVIAESILRSHDKIEGSCFKALVLVKICDLSGAIGP